MRLDKLKTLFLKYRELILYVFFGGLTTLVNIAAYWMLAWTCGVEELAATAAAWVISVLFAYLTNRKWVFQSRASGPRAILWEVVAFFGGRALSGLMDVGIMALFVKTLHYNDLLVKILSNVLVIVVNYIISKWIVFRRRNGDGTAGADNQK